MVCRNASSGTGIDLGLFEVPVIAVFTKYDQFKLDVEMKLEDGTDGCSGPKGDLKDEVERRFQKHYLDRIGGSGSPPPPFVCLESEGCVIHQHLLR